MYCVENYQTKKRFNKQYKEIAEFLQLSADGGFNGHFHRGRFEWMMSHPNLDVEMLPKIAIFKNDVNMVVGVVIYDTCFDDRWYILHSISDEKLLRQMIKYITDIDKAPTIKANLNDIALCKLLECMNYKKSYNETVLAINLTQDFLYRLPVGFSISEPGEKTDEWQWRLVIHRGFDNDGVMKALTEETVESAKQLYTDDYIKIFAKKDGEYVSHCGLWYRGGETAYIEPVATVPEYRRKGLGKAVVYEALKRAKKQGAKRAIVISNQEFYYKIGMEKTFEIATYVK